MLEYVRKYKKAIRGDFLRVCEDNNISFVIPLAKKGILLFEEIFQDSVKSNSISLENGHEAKVITDRDINKESDFEKLFKQKIILFDDSVKTGEHFIHTENYLCQKIVDDLENTYDIDINNICEIFYYSIIRTKHMKLDNAIDESRLFCYKDNLTIREYYNECIEEALYFQKKLKSSAIDLPTYCFRIDNIDFLKSVLSEEEDFFFKDTYTNIGNNRINLGVLIINDEELENLLKGFLIALTCKIRYEYNKSENIYDVLMTPFAIADSIDYREIESLYNKFFDEFNAKTKSDMNVKFVKIYRSIIYILSYYIGSIIKQRLLMKDIDIGDVKDCNIEYYGDSNNLTKIKSQIDKDRTYLYDKLNDFQYTSILKESDNNFTKEYTVKQIKKILYNKVTEMKNRKYNDDNEKGFGYYKYNFMELNNFCGLYRNKLNLNKFIVSLYKLMENFSISNEIEFNFRSRQIERGFSDGECSIAFLPVEDYIFYPGLYRYYKKINKDYQLYIDNYDLFIEKFESLFERENYFDFISRDDFNYLKQYYKDVYIDNLVSKIESKHYILENKEMAGNQIYIQDKVDFILGSDDFSFNKI